MIKRNLGKELQESISHYKILENIRGEERFKQLMEKVKYEWENFEV